MFNDFLEALEDNVFEERPVDAKTFVESANFLGQPALSEIQYSIVEAMSQIYKKEEAIPVDKLFVIHDVCVLDIKRIYRYIDKNIKHTATVEEEDIE